ncbi:MAG: hypothetical protein Q8P18_15520 [Pseudomonadota bacterium]|nr:hypothetical protein [Pseudomonadota bacterium]
MLIPMLTFLAACGTPTEENFSGQATFTDAEPVVREQEPEQGVTFEAEFGGTGSFGDLESICLPTDGAFTGSSSSEGTMSSDGTFSGQVDASGSAELLSALGCVTEALEIDEVTTLTIKASIVADSENCSHYCSSSASSECAAEAGDATAQAECETELSASCTEECTTERSSIVAETSIEGAALTSLNEGLDGEVFGSFTGDFTFDRME